MMFFRRWRLVRAAFADSKIRSRLQSDTPCCQLVSVGFQGRYSLQEPPLASTNWNGVHRLCNTDTDLSLKQNEHVHIAGMAKLADAADLKSAGPKGLWEFDSPSRHQP